MSDRLSESLSRPTRVAPAAQFGEPLPEVEEPSVEGSDELSLLRLFARSHCSSMWWPGCHRATRMLSYVKFATHGLSR